MAYLGNPPATQFASLTYQDLTGGSGTAFTLDSPVGSAQDIEVFVNNVRQEPGVAYTVAGTALTMTGSIASTDDFYVVFQGKSIGTANHPSGSALQATTGTFSGALSATTGTFSGEVTSASATVTGDLTVDTDTLYVDSTNNRVGVGTTSPSSDLHIASTANPSISIEDTDNGFAASTLLVENGGRDLKITTPQDTIFVQGSTESMRIDNNGIIYVKDEIRVNSGGNLPNAGSNGIANSGARLEVAGNSHVFVSNSDQVMLINRQGTDGAIITFYAQGNAEGSISVSGNTISYGGGHLARWSRLPNDTKDTSIVKGTVMTNLDEMVVWQKADGTIEDNEQLNKTDVSSVEGDVNVAGVFDHWDEDDDEGFDDDFYLAETGDFVIRIAQGTTVARGDLLMSAGDGTAKPQGDDIVRSKTVAKVTSTNVSHTYDDGSYLVPCVLMAC